MLGVLLNGIAQLEYDREKPLDANQADYIDSMDVKMDKGIQIDQQKVGSPSIEQRAEFVASNLYHAIRADDELIAAAMCTYLAVRIPTLKQVFMDDKDGRLASNSSITNLIASKLR